VAKGRLSPGLGANLAEAFRLFIRLRLHSQLKGTGGLIAVHELSHAERDMLRQALLQVKKFQQWLCVHFRIRQ
ncbi:MAG: putative nucleotidyltransferase substrate binding domain-containing protein, partial [Shewanella sp.]